MIKEAGIMDKNLKSELAALRSEVMTNLENLKNVVNNIDSKLSLVEQFDGYTITESLDLNKAHSNDDQQTLIKSLDESIVISEKNKNVNEKYNVSDSYDIHKAYVDPIDSKTLYKKFIESSHIDEQFYVEFIENWNKTKKRRIESLVDTIRVFVTDAQSKKCIDHKLNDLTTAEKIVTEFKDIERFKQIVIDNCTDLYPNLQDLLKEDRENDFIEYYNLINSLILNIEHQFGMTLQCNEYFIKEIIELLKTMLEQQELQMYDLGIVNPDTFELIQVTGEKLLKYRRSRLNQYNKDLKKAFEFVFSKNANTEIAV